MLTVVSNLKGGVGKSTLCFNLAVWLLESGRSVSLFDLDPQRTLTDACEVRAEEGYAPALSVSHSQETLIRALTSSDECLVDTGGSAFEVVKELLPITDRLLVPVQPSQADIWSTQRFLHWVLENCTDKHPEILAFINRADTHPAVTETDEAEAALKMLPGLVSIDQRLYQRTAYRRSFSEGLAVFEMGPLSKAGQEMLRMAETLYRSQTQTFR